MSASTKVLPVCALYVGDLDPNVTESMLFSKFSAAGPVLSIRVCRDMITKMSLGYAYVNYQNTEHANAALETLNFDEMNGKPIRIMWSYRDPSLRKSGVGNVFIKNLDKDIDTKVLHDTFSAFGNILSCKVAQDERGNSKGYGFVHYETEEAAKRAIDKVNGMLLNEKKVYVGPFISRRDRVRELGERAKRFTNLFVKNLDQKIDKNYLEQLFKPFGNITSHIVMLNNDGTSRGFGFVAYSDADSAMKAAEEMNGKAVEGKTLFVGPAQKKAERAQELKRKYDMRKVEYINRFQGVNLYVKNLDDTIDDERLRKEFSIFGNITSAKVMTEDGKSKGFGFVCFSTQEEAGKAMTDMNGQIVGSKPLYVALAQRKDERQHHLSSQHAHRFSTIPFSQMAAHPMYQGNPGFIVPTMTQAARFFNPMQPFSHMRPPQRWSNQQQAAMRSASTAAAAASMMPGAMTSNAALAAGVGQYGPMIPTAYRSGPMAAAAAANLAVAGSHHTRAPQNVIRPGTGGAMQNGPSIPVVGGAGGGMSMAGAARQMVQPAAAIQPPRPMPPMQPPNVPGVSAIGTANPQTYKFSQQTSVPNVAPALVVEGQEPLTTSMLAQANLEDQKQMLGERLFRMIKPMYPDLVGKITGMLLEIENSELLHMLDHHQSLTSKVEEAVAVLEAAKTNR